LEKSDFSTVPKRAQKMTKKSAAQELRFFGKIGFLNRAQTCKKNDKEIRYPRNPIFCKNRISQPCPNVQKKMTKKSAAQEIFKNRISQTLPKRAQKMTKKSATQEIRFFAKNRISQTVPKHAQKMTKKSATQEIRFDFLEKSDFF
jgi:hypothetical protein